MKKVQIVSPASICPINTKEKAKINAFFKNNHYTVSWAKYALQQATTEQKTADLMNAFESNSDIILSLRGGYGSIKLLNQINWKKLKKSSSLFVGFSDLTTFQNAYYTKTGKPSLTGFIAKDILNLNKTSEESNLFWQIINGDNIQFCNCPVLSKGIKNKVTGTLVGGNLSCFVTLLGTPYMPNLKNKILLLEDVCEPPYKIDRMLTQLKLAGVFEKIKGIVLGNFYQCTNETQPQNINDTLKEFFQNCKLPVLQCVAYGHQPHHMCLPLGTKATLNTKENSLIIDGIKIKTK